MRYKCKCKEFVLTKTSIVVIEDKVVVKEAYCDTCKTYGVFMKKHKGFGAIIKKPNGTVSKKF